MAAQYAASPYNTVIPCHHHHGMCACDLALRDHCIKRNTVICQGWGARRGQRSATPAPSHGPSREAMFVHGQIGADEVCRVKRPAASRTCDRAAESRSC